MISSRVWLGSVGAGVRGFGDYEQELGWIIGGGFYLEVQCTESGCRHVNVGPPPSWRSEGFHYQGRFQWSFLVNSQRK